MYRRRTRSRLASAYRDIATKYPLPDVEKSSSNRSPSIDSDDFGVDEKDWDRSAGPSSLTQPEANPAFASLTDRQLAIEEQIYRLQAKRMVLMDDTCERAKDLKARVEKLTLKLGEK